MMPLYVTSGVIFPVATLPQPYRTWILWNPMLHGVESARLAFSPYYRAVSGLDLSYSYTVALVCLFFGLGLQLRFSHRLLVKQ
jgi:capsular polysaccharide transport system permease protein